MATVSEPVYINIVLLDFFKERNCHPLIEALILIHCTIAYFINSYNSLPEESNESEVFLAKSI